MKTVIGNDVFIIKFAYPVKVVKSNPRKNIDPKPGKIWPHRVSKCFIKHGILGSEELPVAIVEVNTANCNGEPFNKRIGRPVAFKKAIRTLFADTKLREKFNLDDSHFKVFVNDFKEQCSNSIID